MPPSFQSQPKRIVAILTTLPPVWSVFIVTAHTLSVEGLVNAIIHGPEGGLSVIFHALSGSSKAGALVFRVVMDGAILIWGLSCYVYHMAAVLLGGNNRFYRLLLTSAYAFALPTFLNLVTAVVMHLSPPPAIGRGWLECLTGIGYCGCLIVLWVILKYLYRLGWLPALGAILAPSGVILLLTFYCITHL